MTRQEEFDLLLYVLNARSGDEAALANHCGPSAFRFALRSGFVSYSYARGAFILTEKGQDRLTALQDLLDQQHQQDQAQQLANDIAAKKEVIDRKREFRIKLIGSAYSLALPFLQERIPVVVEVFVRISSLFH